MAKLNFMEKAAYSINMEIVNEDNITIVQSENKMITVAVKANDRMGNFMRVYVAYCGNETPKRKRGINAVMDRYMNDNFILMQVVFGDELADSASRMLSIIEDNYF